MDEGKRISQLDYKSIAGVCMSDHKPVSSLFSVVTKRAISAYTNSQLQSEYYQRQRFESIRLGGSAKRPLP